MRSALYSVLALTLGLGLIAAVGAADKEKDKTPPKGPVVPPRKGKSETIKLFDGKTSTAGRATRTAGRCKTARSSARPRNEASTYLLTKKTFTDFRLLVTGKLVASETHSGVCFWGRPKKGEVPQGTGEGDPLHLRRAAGDVPVRLGHVGPVRPRGQLGVDAGPARRPAPTSSTTGTGLEILAQGNRVRVAANGMAIIDWRDPEPDRLKEAPIGLQLHANRSRKRSASRMSPSPRSRRRTGCSPSRRNKAASRWREPSFVPSAQAKACATGALLTAPKAQVEYFASQTSLQGSHVMDARQAAPRWK